jgi:hypothetical protein
MPKKEYQPPVVRVVGSLHQLTLTAKNLNNTPDGFTFGGHILTS